MVWQYSNVCWVEALIIYCQLICYRMIERRIDHSTLYHTVTDQWSIVSHGSVEHIISDGRLVCMIPRYHIPLSTTPRVPSIHPIYNGQEWRCRSFSRYANRHCITIGLPLDPQFAVFLYPCSRYFCIAHFWPHDTLRAANTLELQHPSLVLSNTVL